MPGKLFEKYTLIGYLNLRRLCSVSQKFCGDKTVLDNPQSLLQMKTLKPFVLLKYTILLNSSPTWCFCILTLKKNHLHSLFINSHKQSQNFLKS